MKYVNLYTRQHKNSLYELEKRGIITNKEFYIKLHMKDISQWFLNKYKIFVEMAEKRVKRPIDVHYPIWCSVSKNNCLKPEYNSIIYCLSVPIDEIILFSDAKWDYVLNNLYIHKDIEDRKEYELQLKKLNVTDEFNFIEGKYKGIYPDIEKKIISSWDRIFDVDEAGEYELQANLWHIKKEWVKHIVNFGEDLFEIAKDMDYSFKK